MVQTAAKRSAATNLWLNAVEGLLITPRSLQSWMLWRQKGSACTNRARGDRWHHSVQVGRQYSHPKRSRRGGEWFHWCCSRVYLTIEYSWRRGPTDCSNIPSSCCCELTYTSAWSCTHTSEHDWLKKGERGRPVLSLRDSTPLPSLISASSANVYVTVRWKGSALYGPGRGEGNQSMTSGGRCQGGHHGSSSCIRPPRVYAYNEGLIDVDSQSLHPSDLPELALRSAFMAPYVNLFFKNIYCTKSLRNLLYDKPQQGSLNSHHVALWNGKESLIEVLTAFPVQPSHRRSHSSAGRSCYCSGFCWGTRKGRKGEIHLQITHKKNMPAVAKWSIHLADKCVYPARDKDLLGVVKSSSRPRLRLVYGRLSLRWSKRRVSRIPSNIAHVTRAQQSMMCSEGIFNHQINMQSIVTDRHWGFSSSSFKWTVAVLNGEIKTSRCSVNIPCWKAGNMLKDISFTGYLVFTTFAILWWFLHRISSQNPKSIPTMRNQQSLRCFHMNRMVWNLPRTNLINQTELCFHLCPLSDQIHFFFVLSITFITWIKFSS